jgi:hypothetical protein
MRMHTFAAAVAILKETAEPPPIEPFVIAIRLDNFALIDT